VSLQVLWRREKQLIFVVIDRDLLQFGSGDSAKINSTQVLQTVLDGEEIYRNPKYKEVLIS